MRQCKSQLLHWAQSYDDIVWLDSNEHKDVYGSYEAILAVDALTSIRSDFTDAFDRLKAYQESTNDWIFGYLTYDLKNDTEALSSTNHDGLQFPDLYFFQPKKLILISKDHVEFCYLNGYSDAIATDFQDIKNSIVSKPEKASESVKIKLRTSKDSYFEKVERILKHIHRGDIYETNFCMECYAENVSIQPAEVFKSLNTISKPPFATFLKMEDKYVLSASPERFIKKRGSTLISQPIKGTAPRSNDAKTDLKLKTALQNDPKERSENIMIVDLVRNDLSHTAEKGSVKVEELCEVYSFLQVHQMISTISSQAKPEFSPVDIIKSMFPMGSMTGAPKISAMQIIEDLEDAKRGVYSGSVGYIDPDGNFDFNVIIRSILYNESLKYVSYSVGSAITSKSDPLKEYEECLTKAKAMRTVLES